MTDQLSQPQKAALSELKALLASSGLGQQDDSLLATLLEIEQWNVQRAARIIKDDNAAERRRSGADDQEIARSFSTPERQSFQVDDSNVTSGTYFLSSNRRDLGWGGPARSPADAGLRNGRGPGGNPSNAISISSMVWSAITFPLTLAQSLLLFLARIFRLRSLFPSFFPPPDGRSKRTASSDPRVCAERFIRELEEDTGGSVQSSNSAVARTGTAESSEAGPSSHPIVGGSDQVTSRPKLPPFHVGSFNDALRIAKEQIKIFVVILTSREHGDVERFRKTTLVDQELVTLLSKPEFIVWGGDVREREAYQVATQLQATTYPFMAFIMLQPPRTASKRANGGSSSGNKAAVLSRLEGSSLSATSASTVISHISDVLLPRIRSTMERLKEEKRRREMERALKAEQDRAYAEASRRDAERVAKKREEERLRALEAERQRQQVKEKEVQKKKRLQWISWARDYLVPAQPAAEDKAIKLSFRLPDGRNLSRPFKASDNLQSVFAYVETAAADEAQGEASASADPPAGFQHDFKFSLVTGYPRRRLDKDLFQQTLGEIDGLSPSANLIVEGKIGTKVDQGEDSSGSEDEDE